MVIIEVLAVTANNKAELPFPVEILGTLRDVDILVRTSQSVCKGLYQNIDATCSMTMEDAYLEAWKSTPGTWELGTQSLRGGFCSSSQFHILWVCSTMGIVPVCLDC